jgi:hypothetical protein
MHLLLTGRPNQQYMNQFYHLDRTEAIENSRDAIPIKPTTNSVLYPQNALLESQGIPQVAFNFLHIWQGH